MIVPESIMPETTVCIRGMKSRTVRPACAVLFLLLISSALCYPADLVFIHSAEEQSSEQHELEVATRFYGLNLKVVAFTSNPVNSVLTAVERNETVAVVIQADALVRIDQKRLLTALHRKLGDSVPLLIVGVAQEMDTPILSSWSGGAAVGTNRIASSGDLHYVVGSVAGVTQQLTGLEIPFPGNDACYFALQDHNAVKNILSVRADHESLPVFIEVDLQQQRVFLTCKANPARSRSEQNPETIETAFAEIAPVMIFTRYCAGDRGWHALHRYANLTIDDPWLRERYGHLVYKDLLAEMEKHNFHTTIAFIPWNYDRSEEPVIALFRSHPERFSVCVHGDNHDHKEFDDFGSKSLGLQVAAIKQSLARMEKFQTLTGIPYDSVFVFPHNIGSESILEELKTYNFTATVNSSNVPMDRARPTSPSFSLRPVTLSFGDFPSLSRYSALMPKPDAFIGINEFLDNPVLFYGHHDLFANGMAAFNGVADEVNKLQSDIRWRSLGDIAKNLYLVRLRDDSNYDVLTFSSRVDLENVTGRSSVFNIEKEEPDSAAVAAVSVNGRVVPFEVSGGYLHLSIDIPAAESRSIEIRYKNDLDLTTIRTSKNSLRVYLLRMISDFRDIALSEYSAGRVVTYYYYKDEGSRLIVIACGFGAIVLGGCGTWRVLVMVKRKTSPTVLRRDTKETDRTASPTRESCTRS
jgi:hypothetical protein